MEQNLGKTSIQMLEHEAAWVALPKGPARLISFHGRWTGNWEYQIQQDENGYKVFTGGALSELYRGLSPYVHDVRVAGSVTGGFLCVQTFRPIRFSMAEVVRTGS